MTSCASGGKLLASLVAQHAQVSTAADLKSLCHAWMEALGSLLHVKALRRSWRALVQLSEDDLKTRSTQKGRCGIPNHLITIGYCAQPLDLTTPSGRGGLLRATDQSGPLEETLFSTSSWQRQVTTLPRLLPCEGVRCRRCTTSLGPHLPEPESRQRSSGGIRCLPTWILA